MGGLDDHNQCHDDQNLMIKANVLIMKVAIQCCVD